MPLAEDLGQHRQRLFAPILLVAGEQDDALACSRTRFRGIRHARRPRLREREEEGENQNESVHGIPSYLSPPSSRSPGRTRTVVWPVPTTLLFCFRRNSTWNSPGLLKTCSRTYRRLIWLLPASYGSQSSFCSATVPSPRSHSTDAQ